jgi:hypothetical protein
MKPLMIKWTDGRKEDFIFLGWKDDGSAFYATRADGQPAVITPWSAYPANSNNGEPYRFPRIVPLEIVPKQFEIAWSDYHHEVLKQWRDANLAAVDKQTQETLFPSDALKNPRPTRTPAELSQRKQAHKSGIQNQYRQLTETPLVELLDTIAFPYLLEELQRDGWRDKLGEGFKTMMEEAWEFNHNWCDAYDPQGESTFPQAMISDLRSVRLVMRGDDGKDYPLTALDLRRPTDREAQAYAVMQQLLQGTSVPHPPAGPLAATAPKVAEDVTGPRRYSFEEVCQQLQCKPTTLRGYCSKLHINPEAITAVELAQIKDYREKRRQRPHLKKYQGPRHGRIPRRRGSQGA